MKRASVIALSMIIAIGYLSTESVSAKRKYTITQRQEAQQIEITKGLKSNELTLKEAEGLRSDLADVANRIAKMKAKNAGKLSYVDEGKIEKDLNKVSEKIQKLELEKRVTSK